jgi:hypothetical protein
MNETDYTSKEHLEYAASNLAWRPLNLDHNHNLRLGFPDNRLEVGKKSEEGNSIEAVIRICTDEKAKDTGDSIQVLIESEKILHPSIEAHPVCGVHEEGGVTVPTCGYYLDEVALLRKSYKLPGDPLSQVFPLPLNESLTSSLVESLRAHDYGELSYDGNKNKKDGEKIIMKEAEFTPSADWPDSCFAYVPDSAKGENGNKSDRKIPYKYPDGRLAPLDIIRNALARIAQEKTDIPDAEKERIQNMLQGILGKENPEYEPSERLKNVTQIATANKENADSKQALLKAVKEKEIADSKLQEKDIKIIELTDENAILRRENSEHIGMSVKVGEITEKLVKENVEIVRENGETKGKLQAAIKKIEEVNGRLNSKEKEMIKMQEDNGKLSMQLENARRELNDESSKRAEANQKAINETKERSRIQFENAALREDNAKTTRQLSESSQKAVEDAKRLMVLEEENAQFKREIPAIKEQLDKSKRLTKILEKTLESVGYKVKNVPA